jgi:hypothetical protein
MCSRLALLTVAAVLFVGCASTPPSDPKAEPPVAAVAPDDSTWGGVERWMTDHRVVETVGGVLLAPIYFPILLLLIAAGGGFG